MLLASLVGLFLVSNAQCIVNNVCPTYLDYYTIKSNPRCWYDVAADQNATTIILSHGYGAEIHKVITADGYIITLFRIVNYHHNFNRKVPVLLQHGLLYSGACFIGKGKDSLGFTLADAGYDVWLGNMRGTQYSEEHVSLTKHDIKFWRFDVDDISIHDVAAQLRYIAGINSKNGKIIFIGHSLGGTTALTFGATFPQETQNLVKLFILLAPNGGIENTKSIFLQTLSVYSEKLVSMFINNEFAKSLANGSPADKLATSYCLKTPKAMKSCMVFLNYIIMGPQRETDASIVPIFFNQFPAGTGWRVIKQITDAVKFGLSAYDFGAYNRQIYGTNTAPQHDVSKIKVPIYIVYSNGDWCITKTDSEKLYSRLSPEARIFGKMEIMEDYFNHNDFLFGRNAKTILYDKLVLLMNSVRYH